MINNGSTILNDALYYPYINLPNDSWLRTAVLFWDTINPIVPSTIYYNMDSKTLLKILESNNAASVVFPREIRSGRDNDVFTESVLSYAEKFTDSFSEENTIKSFSKIHSHKMPSRLQNELKRMDLLKTFPDDNMWYYLYKPLADVFMGELARFLSNRKGMVPISDQENSSDHIFGQPVKEIEAKSPFQFLEKILNKENKFDEEAAGIGIHARQIAVKFLIKNVLPTPSSDFNIETLLKIKEDNKRFLYKFRNSFRTTFSIMREKKSKNEVLEELQKFSDSMKDDVSNIKELFLQYGKDIQLSDMGAILAIDKPIEACIKMGLVIGGVTITPLLFVALVLSVGYDIINGRNILKKELENSISSCAGAYVYKLEEDLSKYKGSGYS